MEYISSTYTYESGWRLVSKHMFGTVLSNVYTNEVMIISDKGIHKILM